MSTAEKGTQRFIQRVFPQQGGGASGGTTTVTPTWTTLAAINDLLPGFPIGALVVTQSQGSVWELRALQTPVAGSVITALSGTHSWVRVAEALGQWRDQANFFVDNTGGLGSDENSGLTALTPLLTVDEYFTRIGGAAAEIRVATQTVSFVSDYLNGGAGVGFNAGVNGNINFNFAAYYGAFVVFQGINKTPLRSGSISAVTNGNRVTGVETQITDAGVDFSTMLFHVIQFTVSGATGIIKRAAGLGHAVLGPVLDPNTLGIFALVGNEAYTVLNPVQIAGTLSACLLASSFQFLFEINDLKFPLAGAGANAAIDINGGGVVMNRCICAVDSDQDVELSGEWDATSCSFGEAGIGSRSIQSAFNGCVFTDYISVSGEITLYQCDMEAAQLEPSEGGTVIVPATDFNGAANALFIYGNNATPSYGSRLELDGGLVFLNQGAVANCLDIAPNAAVQVGATVPIVVGAAPTNAQVRLGSPANARTTTFGAGLICLDTQSLYNFIAGAAPSGTTVVGSTSTPTANVVTQWDGSSNLNANSFIAPAAATAFFKQADLTSVAGTGAVLTVQAQNETGGGASVGGALALTSGTGTTAGNTNIQCGGVTVLQCTPTLVIPSQNIQWPSGQSAPTLSQANLTSVGGTGQVLLIQAQNETGGGGSVGGILDLRSGTGVTNGNLNLRCGSSVVLQCQPSLILAVQNFQFSSVLVGPTINQAQQTAGAGTSLFITAQSAQASGSVAGGNVQISGGVPNGTGIKGGVRLRLAASTDVEIECIEVVQGQRVVALCVGANVTATNVPASTGDRVIFIANAATSPVAGHSPSGGGILCSIAGALNWLGSSGTLTPIAPA